VKFHRDFLLPGALAQMGSDTIGRHCCCANAILAQRFWLSAFPSETTLQLGEPFLMCKHGNRKDVAVSAEAF
ncbi:MAG: hypothetical protein WAM69_07840, partial [Candidatus Sulfotelmatobacter sp.]